MKDDFEAVDVLVTLIFSHRFQKRMQLFLDNLLLENPNAVIVGVHGYG